VKQPGQCRARTSLVCRFRQSQLGSDLATHLLLFGCLFQLQAAQIEPDLTGIDSGVVYTNEQLPAVPWSIHVAKVPRNGTFELRTRHSGRGALGLSPLVEQIGAFEAAAGKAVAAINGGFFQRDQAYAGSPRGLQIVDGELLSAPTGSTTFWVDLLGDVHLGNVASRFSITSPQGTNAPAGLNGPCADDDIQIYSPAIGASTRTKGTREFVLGPVPGSPWLPLRPNRVYTATVREVREGGNANLGTNSLVVAVGKTLAPGWSQLKAGATLRISTACEPALTGVWTALSGGPALVQEGRRQKFRSAPDAPYEFSSMLERHPRTAFGWNKQWYFLVLVDGRQKELSVGMTLDELSAYMVKLGCEEALNLDGGGSATLWCQGQVRNSPCDGYERAIANSLLVARKQARPARLPTAKASTAATRRSATDEQ
jgi:hypothetical protein